MILRFDAASVATVSVILGCMFVFSGVQQIVVAALTDRRAFQLRTWRGVPQ